MEYLYLELPNPDLEMFYQNKKNKGKDDEEESRCIVISMIDNSDDE